MAFLPYSLELQKIIFADIKKKTEKEFIREIINRFKEKGLPIKARYMFPKKPLISFYRGLCFIKKSNATVVIDARKDCNFTIYIRIENRKTLDKLSEFTDNIRNQILNARDCTDPNSKDCKGKIYIFNFNGHKYIKCISISCNFKFNNISKSDFTNIMDIINGEIDFLMNNK